MKYLYPYTFYTTIIVVSGFCSGCCEMRFLMRTVITVIMILFLMQFASGQAVLFFEKEFDKMCKSQRPILAKKVYLSVVTSIQEGTDPCQDQILHRLISSCGSSALTCRKLLSIYNEINNRYEGRVIGR